jgi:hypothetical protein
MLKSASSKRRQLFFRSRCLQRPRQSHQKSGGAAWLPRPLAGEMVAAPPALPTCTPEPDELISHTRSG